MNEIPMTASATITENLPQEMEARLLRVEEVSAIIGYKRTAIWHKYKPDSPYYDPTFPKPIRLGRRTIAWNSREIQEWINRLSAQKNTV